MTDLSILNRYDIRGEYPSEIDEDLSQTLAEVVGDLAKQQPFFVGRDQRATSATIYPSVIQGLQKAGCEVLTPGKTLGIDGFATTDMTAYLSKTKGMYGIQVTASHMPNSWTGIKPITPQGRIFNNDEMKQISDEVQQRYNLHQPMSTPKNLGQTGKKRIVDDAQKTYVDALSKQYRTLFDDDLSQLDIVVDPGNAAGMLSLPQTLSNLGATVQTIHDDVRKNPERSLEPNENTLGALEEAVQSYNADLGLATDGDADRVVAVNERGNIIPGSQSLALLGEEYVKQGEQGIACSVDTSSYVQDVIEAQGGQVEWTPLGAVFTALTCLDKDFRFGGQPNGHMMDTAFTPYDSGSGEGTKLAGLLAKYETSASQLQQRLPEHHVRNESIQTPNQYKTGVMDEVRSYVRKNYEVLSEKDGVKARSPNGEFTVRPSGTEPVIRVTTGSDNPDGAEYLMQELTNQVTTYTKKK